MRAVKSMSALKTAATRQRYTQTSALYGFTNVTTFSPFEVDPSPGPVPGPDPSDGAAPAATPESTLEP